MTRKRILIRFVIWAAVCVGHYFFARWAGYHLIRPLVLDGPSWLASALEYALYFPVDILRPLGVRLPGITAGRIVTSVVWTVTVAATVEGARWLWSIRTGRRWQLPPRELGPAETAR